MLADTTDTGISVVDWEYGVMVMVCEEFSLKKYAGHWTLGQFLHIH